MPGKSIELNFTVAEGSSGQILQDLGRIVDSANGSDRYTGLDYHVSQSSRSALTKELQALQKQVESTQKKTTLSTNTAAIDKEAASRQKATTAAVQQTAATEQLAKAQEASNSALAKNNKESDNVASRATRMNNLQLQMGNYAKQYGENLSKNATLQAKFNDLLAKMKDPTTSPQQASKMWSEFRLECRQAGVEVETLGQKLNKLFGESFKTRARSMLSMAALMGTRQILSDVKEIDVAMTELRKVTDETADTYNKFMQNSGTRAKEIGSTMSDVIKSTADFARLGYNIQDASKLADAAIVLKNVGDGISDIDDASEKIISVVKAFPEFEGNAMTVVDKINEVGKQYCPAA